MQEGPPIIQPAEHIRDLITHYVAAIEAEGDLASPAVKEALLKVQRHQFLEGFYRWQDKAYQPCSPENADYEALREVYSLQPLCIKTVPPASCSDPGLVAAMLELLRLEKGMRVLEIGAGSGYNAALMFEIVGEQGTVVTLEIQHDLAEKAERLLGAAGYGGVCVHEQDGFYGWPEEAPYDRIIATVGCFDISPFWFEQLGKDGYMLIPLNHAGFAFLAKIFGDGQGRLVKGASFVEGQGNLSGSELWSRPGLWPRDREAPVNDSQIEVLPWLFKGYTIWDFELFVGLRYPEVLPRLILKEAEGGGQVACKREMERQTRLLYKEFESLGSPKVADYKIEFAPKSKQSKPVVTRVSSNEWIVEREWFVEKVSI